MSHDGSDFARFRAPLYVAWEITHRCNAQCIHCYSASGPDAALDELTTGEALALIDDLAEAGVLVLALSGGEPLLRSDWATLVGRAVVRGLSVNVGTNGSSITPQNADELQAKGVHSVTVSIDSHRAEVHDEFRRLPGLFRRATEAVRLLSQRGIRVVVGYTPTRLNHHDGQAVVELAASLGASAVNLSEYVPAGRGSADLAPTPGELREILTEWVQLRSQFRGRIDVIWHDCRVGLLVPEDERRAYLGCGAGRLVARICPDGVVTPCVFLPTSIGTVRDESFADLWNRAPLLRQFRVRHGQITGNCGTCNHLSTCGGCRAVAYARSGGNALAGDPHCWIEPAEVETALVDLADGESLPV